VTNSHSSALESEIRMTGLRSTTARHQYDNFATEEPVNIPSQDFETALDFFDSQAADDFIVPAGQTWQVTEVDVLGEYDSTGPAASSGFARLPVLC
jgi:hypothetical protein